MSNRIKPALDCITADSALKTNTAHAVSAALHACQPRSARPLRYAAAVAACLVLLLGLGGCGVYFTPVATISVDINPSLELSVNRFDRVIGAEAFNEDAEALLSTLSLRHRCYEDAIALLLESDLASLTRDTEVSITVLGSTDAHSSEILQRIRDCGYTQTTHIHCHSGSPANAAAAQSANLSLGKYEAYLLLRSLGSAVTVEEIRDLSMNEIYLLIESLGNPPDDTTGNSTQSGGHHGHGGHH